MSSLLQKNNSAKYVNIVISWTGKSGTQVRKLKYVKSSHQFYHNALHHMLELSSRERAFFDFLCESMDAYNRVTIDNALKNKFISLINSVTSASKSISLSTVNTALAHLVKLSLILRIGGLRSSFYLVNPKYACSGSNTRRAEILKEHIERRIRTGQSIAGLINVPEADFLKEDSP